MRNPEVGRVVGLWRYPVKSMSAELLGRADVSWHGLTGDRRWAFVRPGIPSSGFPWLTLREHPTMATYRPSFVDPERPDRSDTRVIAPNGQVFDVTDPALAAALGVPDARVIRQDRGIFDTFPLSLITTRTLAELGRGLGLELDVQRFRPNLLVEATGDAPFPEDAWVGHVLRVGSARVRIDKRDGRCAVITLDPTTGERAPEILRAVVERRQGCAGIYASTVQPGTIAVGDALVIEN
jgi:uncharacterized protein YcbX